MSTPVFFHLERHRPGRLLAFVAGITGGFALLIIAPSGPVLAAGMFVCGALLAVGAPVVLGGATWECWIASGRLYWVSPGWLWGRWASCTLADISEFVAADASSTAAVQGSCCLVLCDGSQRTIERRCFGDPGELARALQQENPQIAFRRLRD